MTLDRTKQPEIKPLKRLELPLPKRLQLSNGSRFALLDETVQEDVFRLDILINGGQWRQTMPLQSSFTNRMLGEGTRSMSSEEISEQLDRYGAWLEYGTGVSTNSIYLFSLNKYAKETLTVLEKIIKEPSFPSEEFQVMVDNAKQRYLVNSKKVDSIARVAFNKMVLGTAHPCARYACAEDYDRIQTSSLMDFYTRYYHSQNASVYLSGNPDGRVHDLVLKMFGEQKWGIDSSVVPIVPIAPVSSVEKRQFIEVQDSLQSAVRMGCLTIRQNHPDYVKLSVMLTLLGGYFGSRLMSNIREDKGYTYGIGCGLMPYPYESVLVIASQCDAKYVEPLIHEVYHEIDRLRSEQVPQEELDMVKSYLLGEQTRRYEGLSLADAFTFAEVSGFPDDFMQQKVEQICQVSVADIQEMANKYLCPDSIKEVIAGKKI